MTDTAPLKDQEGKFMSFAHKFFPAAIALTAVWNLFFPADQAADTNSTSTLPVNTQGTAVVGDPFGPSGCFALVHPNTKEKMIEIGAAKWAAICSVQKTGGI